MRARRKIKVTKYDDPCRPHLKYYVGYPANGRRSRRFFVTHEEAQAFADTKNAERVAFGKELTEKPWGERAARGRGAVNLATARGRAAFARAIQPRPGRGFRLPGGRGR
jgi:hypothetical protein